MINSGVRVMFLRKNPVHDEKRGKPIGSIAIQVDGDTVKYQVVTVNMKVDKFDRVEAARLAKERLDSAPLSLKLETMPTSMHDISAAVMVAIAGGNHPTASRNAARRWLRLNYN